MVKLSKTGFTLIELLVVIAIITIISGMIVVNFRKGEAGGRRQRSAQQIVQNIRKIQNMAISSVEYQGEVYSYGVHFDKNEPNNREYIIFADKNDSGRYDAGDDIIGSLYNLETGVEIDDLSTITEAGDANVDVLDIVFIPPDPLTKFNDDFNIIEAEIVIKEEKTKWYAKTIRVGKAGWVSVE
jgi:prepilin-type N-terminal cleavage/methylation domain-containing protein